MILSASILRISLSSLNSAFNSTTTGMFLLAICGMYLFKKRTKVNWIFMVLSCFLGFPIIFYILFPFIHVVLNVFSLRMNLGLKRRLFNRFPLGFEFSTKKGKIYLDNPFRGIYIQGGAGSGKSNSLFEPIIDQMVRKEYSGLLYDFKSPELTKYVFNASQKYNSTVQFYIVDFKDAENSHRINPINPIYLRKTAYAFEFSKALINNLLPETVSKQDFWGRNAQNILAGVIWYMKNKYPNNCTLPHVISLLLHTDIETLLSEIVNDPEAGGMVASLKQAIDRGAERQVAGVLSTLQNALSTLNTPDVFWILSGQDFNLELNNKENPSFLCVGNESSLSDTYAPVISLIITVASKLMNRPNKHHSIILLDEAPTLYIPNFEQIPATARSNKVATVFGAQDISQIVDKYGREKSKVIVSNLGNQFYGRTTNADSATMIKNIFGRQDRTYFTESNSKSTSSKSFGVSYSKGKSQNIQERDRVKVNEITTLNAGQFYGIIADGEPKELLGEQLKPFKTKLLTINSQENKNVSRNEMQLNYDSIIKESKNLFKNQGSTGMELKLKNKYLNLEL